MATEHGPLRLVDRSARSLLQPRRLRHAHAHGRGPAAVQRPDRHPARRARVVPAAARPAVPRRRPAAAGQRAAPAQAVAGRAAGAPAHGRRRAGGPQQAGTGRAAAAQARQLHGAVPLQDLQHGPQAQRQDPAPGPALSATAAASAASPARRSPPPSPHPPPRRRRGPRQAALASRGAAARSGKRHPAAPPRRRLDHQVGGQHNPAPKFAHYVTILFYCFRFRFQRSFHG